jgi:alkylated DNA repair dioxygenase AlkB
MPPVILRLLDDVRNAGGVDASSLNHCIVIKYEGPQHFAPPHHDKQAGVEGSGAKDIMVGTSIYSVSLGEPRTFQLLDNNENVVWSQKLAHGSLFQLHPETNKALKHEVPKENVGGTRYSIIFRSIINTVVRGEDGSSCFKAK